jgi:hypothetical protein
MLLLFEVPLTTKIVIQKFLGTARAAASWYEMVQLRISVDTLLVGKTVTHCSLYLFLLSQEKEETGLTKQKIRKTDETLIIVTKTQVVVLPAALHFQI